MAAQTTVGVKLDKAVRDRLKALAQRKERTPHWLLKKAVEEYLAREEAWEQEKQEDRERWAEYEQTGEAFGLEDVRRWMQGLRRGERRKWPR